MRDITDVASELMIVTFRITTDITFRTLIHITAIIRHITPTILTTLITPITAIMDIGTLIGMVGNIIVITHPVTTRIATFIMERNVHEVIEVSILGVRRPIDQARKWILN
ncbi:MAG: hypothetical protein OXT74_18175 [Candidatus Poribacteria bacterium]|nr:hypothetical protein [Candidatus Poribacteria bacterium]